MSAAPVEDHAEELDDADERASQSIGSSIVAWPNQALEVAFDRKRSQLAAIGPWGDAVGFVPLDDFQNADPLLLVKKYRLAGTPSVVCFKPMKSGDVFVVGQHDPGALVMIDAETHERNGGIILEGATPIHVAGVTDPASSLLYASSTSPRLWGGIIRVDLTTSQIVDHWTEHSHRRPSVARDPRLVYMNEMGVGRTTSLFQVADPGSSPEESTRWEQIAERTSDKAHGYLSDDGRVITRGYLLYDPQLKEDPIKAEFIPQDFVDGTPWMVGLLERDVVIGARTDGSIVQRIPLPQELFGQHKVNSRSRKYMVTEMHSGDEVLSNPVFVWCDWDHSRLVVTTALHACVVPFDKSALPESTEPVPSHLPTLAESHTRVAIRGEPFEIDVVVEREPATVELMDAPEGVTLQGRKILWTPDIATDQYLIQVRVVEGDVAREVTYRVNLEMPSLKVPFFVRGCDPSTDGRRAVVWGADFLTEEQSAQKASPLQNPTSTRLALMDVPTRSILKELTLPFGARDVELNGTGLYVLDYTGEAKNFRILRYDAETLEPGGQAVVRGEGSLKSIGDKYLLCGQTLSLPDLQTQERSPWRQSQIPDTELMKVGRIADGWYFDGCLWDREFAHATAMVTPQGFVYPQLPNVPLVPGAKSAMHGMFGQPFYLPGQGRSKAIERTIYLSPDLPLRMMLTESYKKLDNPRPTVSPHSVNSIQVLGLQVNDLVSGEDLVNVPLKVQDRTAASRYPYTSFDYFYRVETTQTDVLATIHGSTFVIPLDELPDVEPPFRVLPRQSTLVLSSKTPTTVSYEAPGAILYHLASSSIPVSNDAVKLSSDDGTFQVDLAPHVEELAKIANARLSRNARLTVEEQVTSYIEQASDRYRTLTGRKPSGVPIMLRFAVEATNANLDISTFHHSYLVDLPTSLVLNATEASK
ncbi:MAG: hypothetical protein KDA93_04430 [Planctomycetaceae bacterium]|nr:hypothetical protein [Planctomycetaceae bacterium]